MIKYLHGFFKSCQLYFILFLINFISTEVILDLSCSLIFKVSHSYNKVGIARTLYIFAIFRLEKLLKLY